MLLYLNTSVIFYVIKVKVKYFLLKYSRTEMLYKIKNIQQVQSTTMMFIILDPPCGFIYATRFEQVIGCIGDKVQFGK